VTKEKTKAGCETTKRKSAGDVYRVCETTKRKSAGDVYRVCETTKRKSAGDVHRVCESMVYESRVCERVYESTVYGA
jgi:hypothetical protein